MRIILLLLTCAVLMTSLAGCIVPVGGGPGWHDHWHDDYHHRR